MAPNRAKMVLSLIALIASVGFTRLAGCQRGPELGTVTGTVTLNGRPLEKARVTFNPENGRMSVGETNADGVYELRFPDGRMGAELGEHVVAIETWRIEAGGIEHRETLPKKYNVDTELTRTVSPGNQVIEFELTK